MDFGARVCTRTVRRERYERMLQEELERVNRQIALDIEAKKHTRWHRLPSFLTYTEIATSRKKVASLARFRIYRELRAMGFSFPSIAKVAGFDHTSVLHGINRINLIEAVSSPVERPSVNTSPSENITPTKLTGGAANPHKTPASVEVVVTIAA